jgi:murein DD-endopeptidase MepM/ murein hydrolase activator NlpD
MASTAAASTRTPAFPQIVPALTAGILLAAASLTAAPASAQTGGAGGEEDASASGAGVNLEWGSASPRKAFLSARGGSKLIYKLRGTGTRDLRINVVRLGDGLVRTYKRLDVPTGRRVSLKWNGMNMSGKPAKRGRYGYKIKSLRTREPANTRKAAGKRSFEFYLWKFPVRGRHDYGGASARFGAARSGHRHQGHDVFARCGTRLVAPRGGRVQYRAYQGAAGYYVVLDMWHTGIDSVFMHLQKPATAAAGAKVRTGQKIGYVGETGNASGCHLHFELWTKPGWYQGGSPFDPLPKLKKWDRWS